MKNQKEKKLKYRDDPDDWQIDPLPAGRAEEERLPAGADFAESKKTHRRKRAPVPDPSSVSWP